MITFWREAKKPERFQFLTLIYFVDAQLSVMVSFLHSNGLNKISFIIVNSANASAHFDQLRQHANSSNVHIFQDAENGGVWQLLNGKNYDVFVYNR